MEEAGSDRTWPVVDPKKRVSAEEQLASAVMQEVFPEVQAVDSVSAVAETACGQESMYLQSI